MYGKMLEICSMDMDREFNRDGMPSYIPYYAIPWKTNLGTGWCDVMLQHAAKPCDKPQLKFIFVKKTIVVDHKMNVGMVLGPGE